MLNQFKSFPFLIKVTTDEVTTTKNEPCVDNEYWCQFVAYDLEQCERYPCVKKEACRRTCGECTDSKFKCIPLY